jgi:enediyne biosynthesis protein E4
MKLAVKIFIITIIFSQFFSCKNDPSLFNSLPADETGITFSNRIIENDTMNILDFEYIYNGGGVGIGDFNGDGLQDAYFTGNQVDNKLYLNRTDTTNKKMRFEDITVKSNTSSKGKWCSGVAVADINADGKMDIYVCANVKKTPKDRENLLFINKGNDKNGIPIFAEMAKDYGLADTTFSTNAAFFDYDNDGDLDIYILVDKIDKKSSPSNFHNKLKDGTSGNNDQLYRNDFDPKLGHSFFTNVTKEAGINIEGFGLGINITDINRDGWKDIFVTNDFITNDLLWINNGKSGGKHLGFTDKAAQIFKHTSASAMGNDVTDINNDGLVDVFCLDMLPEDNYRKKMLMMPNNYQNYQNNELYGFQYQYVRNTLQLNQGPRPDNNQPIFSEISLLAGVGETDWSWCPLIVDFDNDGLRDIIVTNGFPKDITDHDFITFRNESGNVAGNDYLLAQIPQIKIKNYAFKNIGNRPETPYQFENVTNSWGINQPSFSNGAAYADLDNDGDVDYLVNNINDSAFVYQNQLVQKKIPNSNYLRINFKGEANNTNGIGTIVELSLKNGQKQIYENSPFRGYLSTVEAVAHFGLGDISIVDEVKIIWQDGKQQILKNVKANQNITVSSKNSNLPTLENAKKKSVLFTNITDSLGINYTHNELDFIDFNYQKLLPHKFSEYGPSLAVGDVTGDGLEDVFIGGSNYRKGKFLIQNKAGKFLLNDLLPGTDTTKKEEDAGSLLFDADNDQDLDLYVVSGGNEFIKTAIEYQDRLYINDGKGKFSLNAMALPNFLKSGSCIKAADFDKDGDLDLFIGGRLIPENYPKATSSYILRNDTKGGVIKFTDITKTVAPELINLGLTCDILWTDYDNDGWLDIALAGEWMPIRFFKNNQGKSFNIQKTDLDAQVGWWNSLVGADFDNDGDIDYIAGNLGVNSLSKASDIEPFKMYGKDFNIDGNYDAIPTIFYPDVDGKKQEFPYNVREDMIKQLITTRAKFPDYGSYAKAKITDMFSPEELHGADLFSANYMKSSYIENLGSGKFKMKPLPVLAQTAPLFGMLANDFDGDGNMDVLIIGNDYGAELTNGRYDAMNGLYMKNDGKGNFTTFTPQESGFYVPFNAKAIVNVTAANGQQLIMASQNRGKLLTFKTSIGSKSIPIKPTDIYALLTSKNGKTRKEEFYFGNSFYSSSGRTLYVNGNTSKLEIVEANGKKRSIDM